MDGTRMEPNTRYLMRVDRKQIPVIYNGWQKWSGQGGEECAKQHAFTRLDTGEWVFKRSARALSKHYDDCVLEHYNCTCHERLEAVGRGAPAQPTPATVAD